MKERTRRVSKYLLKHPVGHGAFGQVYIGQDLQTCQTRAIKVISNSHILNQTKRRALQRQVKIMQELKHQNIVRLYDYFATQNNHYLVMQYCGGGDLSSKRGISQAYTYIFLRQIISALKELQKQNIVHRDLKPANILLSDSSFDASIKLADFGLARQVDIEYMASTQVGTPYYMSPELLSPDSRKYNADKADIWSVGCITYELITGSVPFKASSMTQLEVSIRERLQSRDFLSKSKFSDECADFLRRIFVIDPDQRISFEEMSDIASTLGWTCLNPIVDIWSVSELCGEYELQIPQEAASVAQVLRKLAPDVSHPFLFYLKATQILKPCLKDERCQVMFLECFQQAERVMMNSNWKETKMNRLVVEKAVELCQSTAGDKAEVEENCKQALGLLSSIKPNANVVRFKQAIKRRIESINS